MISGFQPKDRYGIDDLLTIMALLRSENGCPWDREQTHKSIRKNFIEETYEVVEAIDNGDKTLLREELGDVLLQVVFHAQMETEAGQFSFEDVCHDICSKLILRHPHIFSNVIANTSDEVLNNWEDIKKQEKNQATQTETLRSVPKVLPALMRSAKVQQRAAKAGFDYPDMDWAMKDLVSEVEELRRALLDGNSEEVFEELGDLLFSVVNVARFAKVDAEECLTAASEKFIDRFEQVERLAEEKGVNMADSSMDKLDLLWKESKDILKNIE